jgi:hypothetical protein
VYVFAVRGEVEKAASDKYDSEMLEPCTDATVVVEEVHMAPVNLNDPKCSAGKFRMAHQSRVAERPQNFRRPYIAKPPRCIYKHRVVARTREDLHDYVLFADRPCAPEAEFLLRLLTALSDSIDRAGCPIPNSR